VLIYSLVSVEETFVLVHKSDESDGFDPLALLGETGAHIVAKGCRMDREFLELDLYLPRCSGEVGEPMLDGWEAWERNPGFLLMFSHCLVG